MAKAAVADASLSLAWGAGLFAGGCLAQLASSALWGPRTEIYMIWFPGAVLLAALLSAPVTSWLACALGLLIGMAAIALTLQAPVFEVVLTVVPVVLVVPIFARLILAWQGNLSTFEDFRQIGGFLVLAVVLLPLVSGTAVYLVSAYTGMRGVAVGGWLNTVLAHALGYILFVPAWLSLVHPKWLLQRDRRHSSTVAVAVVLLVALWWTWREFGAQPIVTPVLLIVPVGVVIWATLRLRMPGTCLMLLAIVVIAAGMSVDGNGPFVGGDVRHSTLSLQLWALALSVVSLLLATLIEQRRSGQQALVSKHREVHDLAERLIAAQEQERTRIARDLHDDISQRLASSSIQLSALRRQVDPAWRGGISQVQNELISLSNDIRHISHELHPNMLRQTGLVAALNELSVTHGRLEGLEIKSHISSQADLLYDEAALCLYRAAQEAISNAIRHGHAHHIVVTLDVGESFAELTVDDDGKGFVAARSGEASMPGLGLVSIDERAKLLGGSFAIHTALGKGTKVCIRIPISPYPTQ
jgi:two-component system sensor histidine kinase UhpB